MPRRPSMVSAGLCSLVAAVVLAGCGTTDSGSASDSTTTASAVTSTAASDTGATGAQGAPVGDNWTVEVVAGDLDHPWDVAQLPDGSFLVDERGGRLVTITPSGEATEVDADFGDLFARGETGLMGLVLDPDFDTDRRFYTCQGNADAEDIRVISWRLSDDSRSAERVDDPLVSGLELSTGRHGGCRLLFDSTGSLLISAGDAANPTAPQSLTELGGKVLRVNPADGSPAEGNPFVDSDDAATRLIYTYGHRNVQGLAVRPDGDETSADQQGEEAGANQRGDETGADQRGNGTGQASATGEIVVTEHGPSIDDEINVLAAGGNYGWNPDTGGGYDESVPMTDLDIAGAREAVWSSGSPTVAVSGATFLDGPQWGRYDGWLAVATLRGSHLMLVELTPDGTVNAVERPAALDGTHGRLREVVQGDDGALYVVTDNGGDDELLKVTLR